MAGASFSLMPFLHIILKLSPASFAGYVLLRFACKGVFILISSSFFLASNGVILVADEANFL